MLYYAYVHQINFPQYSVYLIAQFYNETADNTLELWLLGV